MPAVRPEYSRGFSQSVKAAVSIRHSNDSSVSGVLSSIPVKVNAADRLLLGFAGNSSSSVFGGAAYGGTGGPPLHSTL